MYLRYKTEQEALNAIAQINKNLGYPKEGINAKTGAIDENSVGAETYAKPVECDDGMWAIPKPTEEGALEGVTVPKAEKYSDMWFKSKMILPEPETTADSEMMNKRLEIRKQILMERKQQAEKELEEEIDERIAVLTK